MWGICILAKKKTTGLHPYLNPKKQPEKWEISIPKLCQIFGQKRRIFSPRFDSTAVLGGFEKCQNFWSTKTIQDNPLDTISRQNLHNAPPRVLSKRLASQSSKTTPCQTRVKDKNQQWPEMPEMSQKTKKTPKRNFAPQNLLL